MYQQWSVTVPLTMGYSNSHSYGNSKFVPFELYGKENQDKMKDTWQNQGGTGYLKKTWGLEKEETIGLWNGLQIVQK